MYNWITLLYTWNYHNIVNQPYSNSFFFKFLKRGRRTGHFSKEDIQIASRYMKGGQQHNDLRNASQNHSEVSPHTYEDGFIKTKKKKRKSSFSKVGKEREPSLTITRKVNYFSHYRK